MDKTYYQELKEQAYLSWREDISYDRFIHNLNSLQTCAVLVGHMDYQVKRGGWLRWNHQSYTHQEDQLKEVLQVVNSHIRDYTTKRIVKLFDHVCDNLDILESNKKRTEMIHTSFMDKLDELRDDYIKLREDFLSNLEEYLQGHLAGEPHWHDEFAHK